MRRVVSLTIVAVAITLGISTLVLANGGKAKGIHLTGESAGITFTSDIDPYLFALTSAGKYSVVRIQVRNRGSSRLKLSEADDRIRVTIGDRETSGILNLDVQDSVFWDGLSPSLKRDLAYPAGVDGGEEESVFVFISRPDVMVAPADVKIQYTVKALSSTVLLAKPRAVAS